MSKERIYEESGIANNRVGYGDRPAVVVVDLQKGFTHSENPLGSDLTDVVESTNRLLDAAHGSDVPVVLTRVLSTHSSGADFGRWIEKGPTLETLRAGSKWVEIDDRLATEETDHVLNKRQASAFHETEIDSVLTAWEVDTVIVCGCTTSGCVRASVVDACSHGYRTIVPEESVGDRAEEPHEANLFDMNAKYADVRPLEEVEAYLTDIGD